MAQGLTETSTEYVAIRLPGLPMVTKTMTVKSGANVTAGTLVGVPVAGAVGTPAAGTNTGNGTITGTITKGAKVQAGIYTLTCIATATNAGLFSVLAPDGIIVGYAKVAVAFTSDHLSGLTVADGSTDYALGDTFTITVAAGDGKLIAYNQTTSQRFVGILAENADATSADFLAVVDTVGFFNKAGLTGYSANYDALLKSNLIFVKEAV